MAGGLLICYCCKQPVTGLLLLSNCTFKSHASTAYENACPARNNTTQKRSTIRMRLREPRVSYGYLFTPDDQQTQKNTRSGRRRQIATPRDSSTILHRSSTTLPTIATKTTTHLQLAVPGDANDDNTEPGGAPPRTAGDNSCGTPS